MQRIQASDAVFLDAERARAPALIGGMLILDPSSAPGAFVRYRDILRHVDERLHLAPNLRKRLIFHPLRLDEPRLIDDVNFDLEFHVRHLALPRPRDRRQLNILAARLMSRPMDLDRPLWEMYVIEGLEDVAPYPPDTYALMIKVHHAIFDGAAFGAATRAMMQEAADSQPEPPDKAWAPQRGPGPMDWTISSFEEGFKQMFATARALPGIAQGALRGGMASASELASAVPKTRFQDAVTSHRVFDWEIFQLADMQAIRAALGKPKMNDLILCMIGGALRRYLQRKDELPARSLLAICPINVRGAGDPGLGGNQVTAMRAALGTHLEDAIDRLAYIAASTEQGKSQAAAWGGAFMGNVLALYPYPARFAVMRTATALGSGAELPPLANTIVTNIPQSTWGHYFAGSRVLAYAGFGPVVDGYGVFHTVTGMDWEVSVSITSCREMMPDIADYMGCIRESFEELRGLAAAASVPPAG